MRRIFALTMAIGLTSTGVIPVEAAAASLRGSRAAMVEQNRVAKNHGLTFFRTAEQIRTAVARGDLVELPGNENYQVADFVRYPYAQPEVRLFIERLSAQYREACGQQLVVTSAVRPSSGQPRNAHELSVHPAGMAVDLRVSDRAACRSWLESALLGLERRGVLNGIREFNPPHYHVAVFPQQYMAYVEERLEVEAEGAVEVAAAEAAERGEAETVTAAAFIAAAPGSSSFGVATEEPASSNGAPRGALAATLFMILALPVGIGVVARRFVRR
jgi:hypothetical protein